jgi:hypothetical protein
MSLVLETYSEKAIVLRGAQEQYKEALEAIGGLFNSRLKVGPGWIFPKHKKRDVETLIEQILSGVEIAPPARKQSSSASSSGSSEPEVSKKEYLSLVTRVERLEALVAQLLKGGSVVDNKLPDPKKTPPMLEDIPEDDIELDFDEEEDEVSPVKKLSRPKKAVPTIQSVGARKSFSKPKVNQ